MKETTKDHVDVHCQQESFSGCRMNQPRHQLLQWGLICIIGILHPGLAGTAAEPAVPDQPAISHVVEGVEQGGTMTIFGEGLTPAVQVWLWQPSPDPQQIIASEQALAELRRTADAFPEIPVLPARPPKDAQRAEMLGNAGNPQVLMVRQLGSASPALNDDHIVPTVMWIEKDAGFSEPYLVNAPQLWFASDRTVVPGGWLRLFGINLSGGENNPSRSLIALKHMESGTVFWGRQLRRYGQIHANVRQHEIGFRLPGELPDGIYTVWLHTLAGGSYGWSNGLQIEVVHRRSMVAQLGRGDEGSAGASKGGHPPDPPRVFRVTGAMGDGVSDDTKAIQEVLNQAGETGGGVVVLPAGVFAVTKTMEVPAGVVLQGAGREATSVIVSPLRPSNDRTLMLLRTRTGLQDLGVIAGPGVEINVRVEDQPMVEDVFLRRVKIENTHAYIWDREATNSQSPDFGLYVNASSRGFRLLQSVIKAPMTFRMEGYNRRHRYARIAGNYFETYPHHEQDNVFLLTLSESVFENNVMAYGHRAFTSQRGMWRNFIADNQVLDVRGVDNGSEMFMSEYGHSFYDGSIKPTGVADTSLGLPDTVGANVVNQLRDQREKQALYAFVAAGRGFGQFREVIGQDGRQLMLDQPWRIALDASSEVILLGLTAQNLFLNNASTTGRGVYAFFYGSAINNIVTGNEASGGGVSPFWLSAVASDGTAVLAYNSLVNNRLVRNGGINLGALDSNRDAGRDPLVIGNRIIRNQVWRPGENGSPNQYYASWNWLGGWNAGHGWTEPGSRKGIAIWNGSYNVIENNYIDEAETGIYLGGGRGRNASDAPVNGNVICWNRIERTQIPVDDQGKSTFIQPPDYQAN